MGKITLSATDFIAIDSFISDCENLTAREEAELEIGNTKVTVYKDEDFETLFDVHTSENGAPVDDELAVAICDLEEVVYGSFEKTRPFGLIA
jgi:hypothetical protein